MTPDDVATAIRQPLASFSPAVVAAYVFGSTARGDSHPGSDVDIAVLFASALPARLNSGRFALEGDLERVLGSRVDMVPLNSAPPDLRIRVLRDGQLVYEADRAVRIAFEVQTRNEYWDLEPILRRCRRVSERSG